MAGGVAISHQNTLRKFGADLRWLVEKSGLNPEQVVVSLGVKTTHDQSLLLSTFLREFDGAAMMRYDQFPHMIQLHGVTVWAIVTPPPKKDAA